MPFRLGFNSGGIELALFDHRHADALFALTDRNRDQLREWLPWLDDTKSVEDSRAFIKRSLQQFAESKGFQLGIWSEGELAGAIGYHFWDWPDQKTKIGYWLGAEFQGRGIGHALLQAALEKAQEMGVSTLMLYSNTQLQSAIHLYRRYGFKEVPLGNNGYKRSDIKMEKTLP